MSRGKIFGLERSLDGAPLLLLRASNPGSNASIIGQKADSVPRPHEKVFPMKLAHDLVPAVAVKPRGFQAGLDPASRPATGRIEIKRRRKPFQRESRAARNAIRGELVGETSRSVERAVEGFHRWPACWKN